METLVGEPLRSNSAQGNSPEVIESEAGSSSLPLGELIKLCAIDNDLLARSFFPKAARNRAPAFHKEMDALLDNPDKRFVSLRCFRGSAKTTKLRIFTAKRIAYGISRTIMYVGASEPHAVRSIQWVRSQITRGGIQQGDPTFFAKVFGLFPGKKWTETEIEIVQRIDGAPESTIWLLGAGITGNIRGVNFDDFRPDLIVLDDVVTDENAATKEQRDKVVDLVYGALKNSLTPSTEEPNAKLALLQTPMHSEDVTTVAEKDPQFTTATFGCWTKETADLPAAHQRSSWEERYPTETLQADRRAHIVINKLSKFTREMECRLTTPEACAFRPEWLQYYDGDAPEGGLTVLGVDPVPPPSDREIAKGLVDKDFEAHVVWRRVGGNYYLLDYVENRGHEPNWSVNTFFSLAMRWRIARAVVETVAYQRVLKWLLTQEMKRKGIYFFIQELKDLDGKKADKRPKFVRITSSFSGPASQGRIFVKAEHVRFIQQFTEYGGAIDHDDILDASASVITNLTNPYLEAGGASTGDDGFDDDSIPKVRAARGCP